MSAFSGVTGVWTSPANSRGEALGVAVVAGLIGYAIPLRGRRTGQ